MRTTLALASAVLVGLGLASTPATAAPAETHTERGIVLECTGEVDGLSAYVNLYENDVYSNYVQVILDDDPERSASREPNDIWSEGEFSTSVRIDGRKARIRGDAHPVGRRKKVHEELDDAGYHVVSDGWHRRLANDVRLRYAGTTVPLTCAPAFRYRLQVTKTPL